MPTRPTAAAEQGGWEHPGPRLVVDGSGAPGALTADALLRHLGDGCLLLDRGGRVHFANGEAERLLGRPPSRLSGRILWEELPALAGYGWAVRVEAAFASGEPQAFEQRWKEPAPWLSVWVTDVGGGALLVLRDDTERKRALAAQDDAEQFSRTLLGSVGEGVMGFDGELRCTLWNEALEDLTGYAAAEAVGREAAELLDDISPCMLTGILGRVQRGETVRLPDAGFVKRKDGAKRWIDGFFTPHRRADGGVTGVVGLIRDASERKQSEQRLLHSAFHDPLTGLPNRAFFMDRLRRSTERARHNRGFMFGVLFLDLDRFKVINDSLGHLAGDELLLQMARKLEESVRPGDIVARLGGDEFAILLYDLGSEDDAITVAHRIQSRMSTAFSLGDREVFSSASVGIALSSTGYERAEDLLRDADIAMYRAKGNGRGRFQVFGRDMHEQVVAQLQVETDLRMAIQREQFVLHYQPIIHLRTRELTGFEALLRWEHPEKGLVTPDLFIDVAEDTGLILPIGTWVLSEACRQLISWRERFPRQAAGLCVHVNLSGKQFIQPDGVQQIVEVVRASGVPAESIKLEITESIILENADTVAAALEELRSEGLLLSIDDFGTGYSSLSYLHRFPFDTLKIDRSFVSSKAAGGGQTEIIRAIISLAHNLGMDVIAEGIETQGQLEQLCTLGCELGQGYLFSGALDEARAAEFIDSFGRRRALPLGGGAA